MSEHIQGKDGCRTHACKIHFPDGWINGLKKEDFVQKGIKTREYDANVTQNLLAQNYVVLRFWSHDLDNNFEKCIQKILGAINTSKKT